MGNNRQYLSTHQIARMLGVHPRTVVNWIKKGDLLAVKVGGQYRVSRDALDAFLEERRTNRRPKNEAGAL